MSIWEKSKELSEESRDQSDASENPESQGLHFESQGLHPESHDLTLDSNLAEALRNFKLSVDSWSEAAYSDHRFVQSVPRRSWRPAAAWALGCALVASSVSGVVYQRHERQMEAKQAAEKFAAQQKQAADLQAADEDLLASVDSDVSRQVPSAMEPLAQMAEDESK
jgi:hypothetical protein